MQFPHSLQLIEVAAVKAAVKQNEIEERKPFVLTYDILVQFLVTLAVGEGFKAKEAFELIKKVHAFHFLTEEEFYWCIHFITKGGTTLSSYEEFHKVVLDEDDFYRVKSRRIAMLHRMNIGVIVGEVMLFVKYFSGGYVGMIEEFFISKLKKGSAFILSGRVLEVKQIKDMTVLVKRSKKKKAITPSWKGGSLPLTSYLTHFLRLKLSDALQANNCEKELQFLHPLLKRQEDNSHIPKHDEFLIEMIETREGFHLFAYPFEGRLVHEIMGSLIAYRLSKIEKRTFTIAMNDYGFELLSDQEIPLNEENMKSIFSKENLIQDVTASINASEMASRKFRDIAVIAGLVVQTQPGNKKNNKSLQSSSGLIFRVLNDYEPSSLLLKQAYNEVFDYELEKVRLQAAFKRISESNIILKKAKNFTPLSFPLKVDSLRGTMSNEELSKRIERIQKQALKA